MKKLYINPGESISLQYHNVKQETMMVLMGMGTLKQGDAGEGENTPTYERTITEGDIFTILPKTLHQITGQTMMVILEVSTPETDDLVRVEDKYGRP